MTQNYDNWQVANIRSYWLQWQSYEGNTGLAWKRHLFPGPLLYVTTKTENVLSSSGSKHTKMCRFQP